MLQVLLVAGSTLAKVCQASSQNPKNRTIEVSISLAGGHRNVCFLVPLTETRNCTILNTDVTFIKQGCRNETALKAAAVSLPNYIPCLKIKNN